MTENQIGKLIDMRNALTTMIDDALRDIIEAKSELTLNKKSLAILKFLASRSNATVSEIVQSQYPASSTYEFNAIAGTCSRLVELGMLYVVDTDTIVKTYAITTAGIAQLSKQGITP